MKRFNDIIQNNRDMFDSDEPDSGHRERFRQRLENQQKPKQRLNWQFLFKAAAMLVLVALTSILLYNNFHPNNSHASAPVTDGMRLSDVSPEYEEVETYLQSSVEERMQKLQQIECKNADLQKEDVYAEISELDTVYRNLQKELLHNSNDERIINAMINSYQMKVEVLDKVIQRVNSNCE